MKIVISCAGSKASDAGFMQTEQRKRVLFVADPAKAPKNDHCIYARPDDDAGNGKTWREQLLAYNRQPQGNPLKLFPAYLLYKRPKDPHKKSVYQALVDKYGEDNVYILSAGWGLIPANFLTPQYDITFSSRAERHKRRRKRDDYDDLCLLPTDCTDKLIFFGGKDYLPLFCNLSKDYAGQRIAYYNSKTKPKNTSDVELERYETEQKTNWHYECARAFMAGKV